MERAIGSSQSRRRCLSLARLREVAPPRSVPLSRTASPRGLLSHLGGFQTLNEGAMGNAKTSPSSNADARSRCAELVNRGNGVDIGLELIVGTSVNFLFQIRWLLTLLLVCGMEGLWNNLVGNVVGA
ncbi:hypothetical protein EJB05_40960, partial [Eragrostis curvula]